MKATCALLALALTFVTSCFAKIVSSDELYFIKNKDGRTPISTVNDLIKDKAISKIKTYGDGSAHIISFAKKNGPVKLYSVDQKGFIYSIKPFTDYSVMKVEPNGKFSFQEVPKRKYLVNSKGFFLY